MSFFDDGEETAPRPAAARPPRARAGAGGSPPRQSPRRPRPAGGGGPHDEHAVMMRRRFAAGAGVVLLIVIVLIVNGCLKSQQTQALQEYAHDVSAIGTESQQQVSRPLFVALSGASSKAALDVEEQVDQLHLEAQKQATQAKGLSVPGEMESAQRNLLLALNLRAEGLEKVAGQLRTALGGQSSQAKQANTYIAGNMENFLASDVIYSQRVVPLIEETLKSAGVSGQTVAGSRFLPNIGWLEADTVQSRITGESANAANEPVTGNHGSALKTVSVGTSTLEPEPALNHISTSGNTAFTVGVENSGESAQRNVKVDVTVTVGGKKLTASSVLEKTEPGKTVNAEVTVNGVPAGHAAKVEVNVEGVPGENDLENNKATFLAIFGG